MIPFKRTDHILITVPIGKLSEAQQFYQEVLQLSPIYGDLPQGAIWFRIADIELHVMEEETGNSSKRHPAFEVSDLKVAESFLKSKNISISYSSLIPGRDRCFFRDPFGNRFELLAFH
ncbi:MAG: VOC family protein [Pelobium sp.]